MQRRDFLKAGGAGMACLLLPLQGHAEATCPATVERYRLDGETLSLLD